MALESTADAPLPVRTVSRAIGDWIGRLGRVWVDGQVTQIDRRGGSTYLVLRDPAADVSLKVWCSRTVTAAAGPALIDGARVVIHGRPEYGLSRGSLSFAAVEVRAVGIGELLARLERLKAVLAAEGLFSSERKQPLPFLPRCVGLITGRAGDAEHDVVENARRRWPGVAFEIRSVAVQGPTAATQVRAALRELDRMPVVDVVVIARGGGDAEALLPFSDEGLVREVASCRTPVVSAIGHEQDSPLLDLVADVRASTPTDAGRRVVPDVGEEYRRVRGARDFGRRHLELLLRGQEHHLHALRGRPVLAHPQAAVAARSEAVTALLERGRRCTAARLEAAASDVGHATARVRALSPLATLARGYAVVQQAGTGAVVRAPGQVGVGDGLRLRLAEGELEAVAR